MGLFSIRTLFRPSTLPIAGGLGQAVRLLVNACVGSVLRRMTQRS